MKEISWENTLARAMVLVHDTSCDRNFYVSDIFLKIPEGIEQT